MNQPEPELPSNVFADFLKAQRGGRMGHELSLALSQLSDQVMATGKPGTLSLKLKVAPANVQGVAVIVEDVVDVKPPKVEEPGSLFYLDKGRLTRNNPAQGDFFVRVSTPTPTNAEEEPQQKAAQS